MTGQELAEESAAEVVAVARTGRNAAIQLLARTVAIRGTALVGTAILARILLPEEFGIFAVVVFTVTLVAPFGDFGLSPALIQQAERPTDEEQATAFTLQLATSLVLLALLWVAAPLVRVVAPDMPADTEWMIRAAALTLPFFALRAVPAAMMMRVLRFGPLATIEALQQLAYYATAIGLALQGAGAWSFVVALIVQVVLGVALIQLVSRHRHRLRLDLPQARRMLGFGVPFQGSNLIINSRDAIVPLFGGLVRGVAGIGYLQFGIRMARLVGAVDEVIGRVAFPAFSRLQKEPARLGRAMLYAVESTSILLALIQGWTIASAPVLIPFVFSDRWLPAVPVFQLVALGTLALVPVSYPRSVGFAAGRASTMLFASAATLGVALVLFPLLISLFDLAGGGLAFAIYGVISLLVFARVTADVVPFPWLRMLRIYAIGAASGVVAAVVVGVLGGVVGLVVSGLVYLAVFGLLLVVFERDQLWRSWHFMRDGTVSDPV